MPSVTPIRSRPVRRRFLAFTLVAAMSCVPGAWAKKPIEGEPAVVTSDIHATAEEVFKALNEALEGWRMRKSKLNDGIVKTAWVESEHFRDTFRGRLIAEFKQEGYITHLSVRHEFQRRLKEAKTTITSPGVTWQNWPGKYELAKAVVVSVEEALGQTAPAVPVTEFGRKRSSKPIITRDYVVTAEVAAQVNELKGKRRDVVEKIRSIDTRILDAVYGGNYEEIKGQVSEWKARKAALEKQLAKLDRDILALVLAD